MFGPLNSTIHGVVNLTWPMIIISIIVIISFRVTYLIKNKEHFTFYKELLMLCFIVYILCLFQVVTFQDDTSWASNNFIPFREIFRYQLGSRLFFKNVLGNMLMFAPYGFFISYYLKNKKPHLTIILTIVASVSIEVVQMLIGRVFDVDDIMLNILGGLLGFYIYYLIDRLQNRLPKVCHKEWFLNIVVSVIFVTLVVLLLF